LERITLPPGEGNTLHVLGDAYTIKAAADQTGGTLAVLEGSFRPGSGAPAHVHHQHEESFYVLTGEFLFRVGSQSVRAAAGTFVFAPRDVPHSFENVGSAPGRVLGIMTPAGFEQFFETLARLPACGVDPAEISAILAKYDQEVVELPAPGEGEQDHG
jgi:mannose-6-phosphate isomerase-like protein (cupin superfamily)